jgi:hypothetical protein
VAVLAASFIISAALLIGVVGKSPETLWGVPWPVWVLGVLAAGLIAALVNDD